MMESVEERFTRLEDALVGLGKTTSHISDFFSYFASLVARVEMLEEKVTQQKALEARVASLELELELCKKVIVTGNEGLAPPKRVREPEPKSYEGARDARESRAKGERQSPQTTEDEHSEGEAQKRRERRRKGQRTGSPRKGGQLECYLCNGPHMVRNCPKKKKQLSAIERKGKKEARDSESEDPSEKVAQLESIQLLGSISQKSGEMHIQKKDERCAEVKAKGKTSQAQEKRGATLKFECTDEAKRQGLKRTGRLECFLCNGPHMVKDCPERKALAGILQSRLLGKGKEKALAGMQQSRLPGKGEEASSSNSGHRSYRDVVAPYASA
ncbi:hypothetical protein CsSME_00039896 [Camellia sinensis var. sinensis]